MHIVHILITGFEKRLLKLIVKIVSYFFPFFLAAKWLSACYVATSH